MNIAQCFSTLKDLPFEVDQKTGGSPRYYRYTIDYHLHFFPEPEQLILRMKLPRYCCEKVTGDLCYYADLLPLS